MPLTVRYSTGSPPAGRRSLSTAEIRAVAAQARRQLLADPAELAVPLSILVTAAAEISVNARSFSVQWDLTRPLRDQSGRAVFGICDVDAAEPGWAYVSIDAPTVCGRPDLALSTAAHELGHLLLDVPYEMDGGSRRYRAVARSESALECTSRGAEGRANEFMARSWCRRSPYTRACWPSHAARDCGLRGRRTREGLRALCSQPTILLRRWPAFLPHWRSSSVSRSDSSPCALRATA